MVIVKDIEETENVGGNCNNHSGCTGDVSPEGGGLACGGSVTH